MNSSRFKNLYFWLGLLGVVSATLGITPEHITSWSLLIEEIKAFANNPYAIISVIVAILGVAVDPTTDGIKDNNKIGGEIFE